MDSRIDPLLASISIFPIQWKRVSGGDINDNFLVSTEEGRDYFVKINQRGQLKNIITTEFQGLELMKAKGVTFLPSCIRLVEDINDACLVMSFYPPVEPSKKAWEHFFELLAHMHRISHETFGGEDNYIGLLPQINSSRNNWIPFYRENRLKPQLDIARSKGYFSSKDEKKWEILFDNMPSNMPIEKPSLIHGDLWGGNVISTEQGILLIDPCPHFGHREMDLGMMELFSGIPIREYLPVYESVYPLEPGLFDRIELYQLYYLLVHLNLFGTAYLPGVTRIIKKFSN